MEQLNKYCLTIRCINSLETYIFSPARWEAFLTDKELLDRLNLLWANDMLINFLQPVKTVGTDILYPALVQHKNRIKKYRWEPVFCYKLEDEFHHVICRDSWICRACNHTLYGLVLMPKHEQDTIFYSGTENPHPPVPSVFKKIFCPRCGRQLQNHLILIPGPTAVNP